MPIYSHSQLSTYEDCPLKYKLHYRDKIERGVEGIEAFLGSRVHDTLKKCYDDARLTKVNTLPELHVFYDNAWEQNWHDEVVIARKDLTPAHYKALGKKMIETYYSRYAPFDLDTTIDTEMRVAFSLDNDDKYKLNGFIDRLSRTADGVYHIHDYKTSAHLPSQKEADEDRQLGLYYIGIKKRWPDIKDIKLVWHYLAFDRELVSSRSEGTIAILAKDTAALIDQIESDREFKPTESTLCGWCEYPDLCPNRKHLWVVESLPANEYLNEPGVVLVNKFAELKERATEIETEIDRVREAILNYAKREQVAAMQGSGSQVRIRFDKKLRFPGKNDEGRPELDAAIIRAGKWMEVSQLDTTALSRIIEKRSWDERLVNAVLSHGRIEETSTVFLSRLKDRDG